MQTKAIISIVIATFLLQAQANVQPINNAVTDPSQAVSENKADIVPANFKKDEEEKVDEEAVEEEEEEKEEEEEEDDDDDEEAADPETHIKNVKEAAKAFSDSGAFVFNDEKGFMPLEEGLNEIMKEKTGKGLDEEEKEEDDKKDKKKGKKDEEESEEKNVNAQGASAAVPTASPAVGGASSAPSVKASVSTGVSMSVHSPSISGSLPKFGIGSGKAANSMGVRPTNGARVASPKSSGNTIRVSIGATVGVIIFAAYSLL